MSTQCSRGWGARCARSKGPRCKCQCGGHNHGNPAARRNKDEQTSMKLTDNSIFERPIDITKGDWVDTRIFLADAYGQRDIHLMREGSNALVDIPQRFVVHSPSGLEYGYGGSGPADLALNVLGLFVSPPEAYRLHQRFKWDRIAPLARELNHTITAESVRDWIQDQWHLERAKEFWNESQR